MSKIQIWSNAKGSEFAIRLNTDMVDSFRATTKQGEKYVKIVEETDYLHDMKYEWSYTLRYWVETHYNNRHYKDSGNSRIGTTIESNIGVMDDLLPSHPTNEDYNDSTFLKNSTDNNTLQIDKKFRSPSMGPEFLLVGEKKSCGHKRKKTTWSKPKLKCHYCGLMFSDEMGRVGHEKEWHADKMPRK